MPLFQCNSIDRTNNMSNAYREMFLFVRNYRNRNNLKMQHPLYSDMLYFINFELEVDE